MGEGTGPNLSCESGCVAWHRPSREGEGVALHVSGQVGLGVVWHILCIRQEWRAILVQFKYNSLFQQSFYVWVVFGFPMKPNRTNLSSFQRNEYTVLAVSAILSHFKWVSRFLKPKNLKKLFWQSADVEEYQPKTNTNPANLELCSKFHQVIGSLLCIMIGMQSDIAYAVTRLLQFSANPNQDHLVLYFSP